MPHPVLVLVVEDEVLLRMVVCAELEGLGFGVLEATNATQAVELIAANPDIRVVFTDVDMPGGVDGLKLAASVRDRWPSIKIIVASGHHRLSIDDLPNDSRFFDKPYRADAVATAMREMISD